MSPTYPTSLLVVAAMLSAIVLSTNPAAAQSLTHGPIVGQLTSDGAAIWTRTSHPTSFRVRYRTESGEPMGSIRGTTTLDHDNTGWVRLTGLRSDAAYTYEVDLPGTDGETRAGSFRTLPDTATYHHPEHNPRGLFNLSFAHGSCNFQFNRGDEGYHLPAYAHMLEQLPGRTHFHIMNGDWLYEARRKTTVEQWQETTDTPDDEVPAALDVMPQLAGVWANYRLYLERGEPLDEFHSHVPSFFMFDDHELLNDINGTADAGYRNERTLFRDVGVRAWRDYLGWANPLPSDRPDTVVYGRATLAPGSDVLIDEEADFSSFDPEQHGTLHVHWNDDHPAAGVYEVAEVLGPHRLRVQPPPPNGGESLSYSIGVRSYFRLELGNVDIYVLDTRGHRGLHDVDRPAQPGLSMLGERQRQWLLDGLKESDADFSFVTSTVSFTIPHVAPKHPDKDESWTVYLDEREHLFEAFEALDRPIILLTGDLHNSVAVKVADNVWEFLSGPQNSGNHALMHEGDRPPSGLFTSGERDVDIQWSSFWLSDTPGRFMRQPYYQVIQVNNVFNSPDADGTDRWVAYPEPQVVVQYYDGLTGRLAYAASITAPPRD